MKKKEKKHHFSLFASFLSHSKIRWISDLILIWIYRFYTPIVAFTRRIKKFCDSYFYSLWFNKKGETTMEDTKLSANNKYKTTEIKEFGGWDRLFQIGPYVPEPTFGVHGFSSTVTLKSTTLLMSLTDIHPYLKKGALLKKVKIDLTYCRVNIHVRTKSDSGKDMHEVVVLTLPSVTFTHSVRDCSSHKNKKTRS